MTQHVCINQSKTVNLQSKTLKYQYQIEVQYSIYITLNQLLKGEENLSKLAKEIALVVFIDTTDPTCSIERILTSEAGRGHLPGKHSHPGFR